ncbi:carboxymethylenebutenolidase [Shewanella sp. NFH-SH190041]|uniref:dienelactone hydrolase family protein n=1 Tax=Shewanella sp. NFH-SH190041 TaxID=2950245 RepID=UPI0021C48FD1|nr:dienelactone hydrolase family protein [Shewanella sp. NFH-SH190041]BDM63306.1 carboxymethylenebutenolidase [Shewanella sp. NFH-SH190041]
MKVIREIHDIAVATGSMRTYLYRPVREGIFPSLIFYSEIFQHTGPISRLASVFAGHGFVVLVPEIFHQLNPAGTVLGYDDVGRAKGHQDKLSKPLESHDKDTEALVDFARAQPFSSSQIGALGVCIGGHLAFRATLNPDVRGAFCLYPTDLHTDKLTCESGNQTLMRCGDIQGEVQLVFGRQDPYIPVEGREQIYRELNAQHCNFSWSEVNAEHGFMRDEGEQYDPEQAMLMCQKAVAFFKRVLL